MKILFITLSNIGDVVLTLPVLDALRGAYPQAKVTCLVGPRAAELFSSNLHIHETIIYDKYAPLSGKKKLFQRLKKEKFDIVVDLRNTLFGALLRAEKKTSPFKTIPKNIRHMLDRHLYKINNLKLNIDNVKAHSLWISPEDQKHVEQLLSEHGIRESERIVVISSGARSHVKRWAKEKFAELIPLLEQEFKAKIILVGDKDDANINQYINDHLKSPVSDLSTVLSLTQLAALLKKAFLVITNDSAVLHLSSYLNRPTVAVFGPTDDLKYGPWSDNSLVVKKELFCRPCAKAQCRFGTLECMKIIKPSDVLEAAKKLISGSQAMSYELRAKYKRILVVRTDRIGDALLSTPVVRALRRAFPSAYLAVMVSPYTKDVFEGSPYLDEVIIYDKEGKHKSWFHSREFALNLKKKKFDLTLVLHPNNRVHLVTFFAGIRRRIGYDRKLGFLLTDQLKHTKQLGEKHELEYCLDFLQPLGLESGDKDLFMPIKAESEAWVDGVFAQQAIQKTDKLLAINPGASCPSRIWLGERFAEVSRRLAEKYGFKVILVGGPKEMKIADIVLKSMQSSVVNLSGKTSLSQLASVLKRCDLLISNDSGPVHMASAVGTPVISIFSRNKKGINPTRWGPVGKKDKILHRTVGCIECLAHNCRKQFACLKAITVDDVLQAADEILK